MPLAKAEKSVHGKLKKTAEFEERCKNDQIKP